MILPVCPCSWEPLILHGTLSTPLLNNFFPGANKLTYGYFTVQVPLSCYDKYRMLIKISPLLCRVFGVWNAKMTALTYLVTVDSSLKNKLMKLSESLQCYNRVNDIETADFRELLSFSIIKS